MNVSGGFHPLRVLKYRTELQVQTRDQTGIYSGKDEDSVFKNDKNDNIQYSSSFWQLNFLIANTANLKVDNAIREISR